MTPSPAPIFWHTDHLLEALAPATLPCGHFPRTFERISTDSRTLTPADLFVALRGDTFDGHNFITALLDKGQKGVVATHSYYAHLPPREKERFARQKILLILVEDTLVALGKLARFQRLRARARVIAITGSNGKTSTREMITAILRQRFSVLSTAGNLNNEIGLPLTLLQLSAKHQWAVVELGMNHAGEIERLGSMAIADIAVITNTFRAHLEGLGSVEAVARAKAEILSTLNVNALAILNRDDPRCGIMTEAARNQGVTTWFFGVDHPADTDFSAQNIHLSQKGLTFDLKLPGTRTKRPTPITLETPAAVMVKNALAAAAAAVGAGMDPEEIRTGLARFQPVSGRMEIMRPGRDITLVNDTYNANPGSTDAALALLKEQSAHSPTMAILGDMLELGDASRACHREMGAQAARCGVDYLFAHGPMAGFVIQGAIAAGLPPERAGSGTLSAILDGARKKIIPGMWVLVKGSRGMHMEQVVTAIHHWITEGK